MKYYIIAGEASRIYTGLTWLKKLKIRPDAKIRGWW